MQTSPGTWPFRLLKPIVLLCFALLTVQATVVVRAAAPRDLDGAFGVRFGNPPETPLLGATLDGSPIPFGLYNTVAVSDTKTSLLPADLRMPSIGWRHFEPTAVSPRLRSSGMRFYLLQTSRGDVAMIAALLPGPCDELAAFLARSVDHKYQLDGRNIDPPGNSLLSYGTIRIWNIGSRQIALTCGKTGYLLYSDPARVREWSEHLKIQNDAEIKRDRLELLAEANRLLPGSDNVLSGAFGLLFDVPIPDHRSFPVARKISYDGVWLSAPYNKATYELELADGGYPVRLVGEFRDIDFARVTRAFTSRFGTPFKQKRDHVQYNINGDYLSLQRYPETTRIAVVHTQSDKAGKAYINPSARRAAEAPQMADADSLQHPTREDEAH